MLTLDEFTRYAALDAPARAALERALKEDAPAARAWADAMFRAAEPPAELRIENERVWRIRLAGYFLALPETEKIYARRGFPRESLLEGMTDVGIWSRHNMRNFGAPGLNCGAGFCFAHLQGRVLQFGRLECNDAYSYGFAEVFHDNAGELIRKGTPMISLHIPESGPLDIAECHRSMARMKEFFARYLPDYPWRGFFCHSWLLDPKLAEILPETSRILQFQKLGQIHRDETPSDAVFRVFGVKAREQGVDAVEHITGMQKTLAAYLKAGGELRYGLLFIPRD